MNLGLPPGRDRVLTADEAGVAAIPVSAFYETPPDAKIVRLCFAKNDDTLNAAAERLCRL